MSIWLQDHRGDVKQQWRTHSQRSGSSVHPGAAPARGGGRPSTAPTPPVASRRLAQGETREM